MAAGGGQGLLHDRLGGSREQRRAGAADAVRRSRPPALPVGWLLRRPGGARGAEHRGARPAAESDLLQPRPDLGWATQGVRPSRPAHHSRRPRPSAPTCRARSASPTPWVWPASSTGETPWPADAIVVCSFGDASANHSTVTGALNAASYLAHREVPCPVLFVCEDNRIGISTPSPGGWPDAMLAEPSRRPLRARRRSRPADPARADGARWSDLVRETRRPAVLHLDTVRFMGHAGSDVETAYRGDARSPRTTRRTRCWRRRAACSRRARRRPTRSWSGTSGCVPRSWSEAERVLDEPRLAGRERGDGTAGAPGGYGRPSTAGPSGEEDRPRATARR